MFIVVGLVIAFILVAIYARPAMRNCRWREDRAASRPGQTAYRCAFCGARATTATGKPPVACLKPQAPD
ncbi:hypothetical protein XM53_11230 [Roseovarius atlanticus]|uniref:Uncharacterized protein n=1 Tax=Roseovarius atlanticus TaxID=1641875 RepID=A0A0T5NUY9_9RHOB|nr:hypothetical protein [Roseovarius atlanticus]KRS12636.1 hypothetical protein XM53_11230 [Roseovarius atlanticus]